MVQHMLCCASVELALAQGHPTRALEIIDQLVASAAQAARGQNGGLKARERGIAALIAQGKFKREIADVLVLILRAISPEIYVLPSCNLRTVRDDNARRSGYNCSISRGSNPRVRSTDI